MMPMRTLALSELLRRYSACLGSSDVRSSSSRKPTRPLRGVRISWLIWARNSVLALSPTWAFSTAALSSETSCPTAMNCSRPASASRMGITVRSTKTRRGPRARHSTTPCHAGLAVEEARRAGLRGDLHAEQVVLAPARELLAIVARGVAELLVDVEDGAFGVGQRDQGALVGGLPVSLEELLRQAQLPLAGHLFRDVELDGGVAVDAAAGVAQRHDRRVLVEQRPVLVAVAEHAAPHAPLADRGPELAVHVGPVLAAAQQPRVAAEHVGRGVAACCARRRG